jgi:hypothetical protein
MSRAWAGTRSGSHRRSPGASAPDTTPANNGRTSSTRTSPGAPSADNNGTVPTLRGSPPSAATIGPQCRKPSSEISRRLRNRDVRRSPCSRGSSSSSGIENSGTSTPAARPAAPTHTRWSPSFRHTVTAPAARPAANARATPSGPDRRSSSTNTLARIVSRHRASPPDSDAMTRSCTRSTRAESRPCSSPPSTGVSEGSAHPAHFGRPARTTTRLRRDGLKRRGSGRWATVQGPSP